MNDHLDHVANKMCMEEKWIALEEILWKDFYADLTVLLYSNKDDTLGIQKSLLLWVCSLSIIKLKSYLGMIMQESLSAQFMPKLCIWL
jgi:hypothetical protein